MDPGPDVLQPSSWRLMRDGKKKESVMLEEDLDYCSNLNKDINYSL